MSIDAKDLLEATAIVIPEVYKDVISPPAKEVGNILTDIVKTVRLALFPFQIGAACQDRFQNFLDKVIRKIPKENITEPDQAILVSATQKAWYLKDNHYLHELFTNLLASAMDKTKKPHVHPAFVSIIEQLSPDEALILSDLKHKSYKQKGTKERDRAKSMLKNWQETYNEYPIDKLSVPNFYNIYLQRLENEKLIIINTDQKPIRAEDGTGAQIGMKFTYEYSLSEFGKLFAETCMF